MPTVRKVKGKSPSGGVLSVLHFTDNEGKPIDESEASFVKIVEYGPDGTEINTIYGTVNSDNQNKL